MARRQPPAGGEPDEVADLTQAMSGRAMLGLGRRPIRVENGACRFCACPTGGCRKAIRVKIVRIAFATARKYPAEFFDILPLFK